MFLINDFAVSMQWVVEKCYSYIFFMFHMIDHLVSRVFKKSLTNFQDYYANHCYTNIESTLKIFYDCYLYQFIKCILLWFEIWKFEDFILIVLIYGNIDIKTL